MMATQRTALITGASAGLGSEFARQLAARGCNLVLIARRIDRLTALGETLSTQHGIHVKCIAADLSRPEAAAEVTAEIATADISIDYLINNAGIAGGDLLGDEAWADHQQFCQLMMVSVLEMCHRIIPGMRQRGFGRVINVASVAGRIPRMGGCLYGPSKAYLVALSEDLAVTLHGSGVQVCALCPGFTHTEFHATAGLQEMKDKMPGWLWYDADVVVREGLRAVEKGTPVYLSGRLYRWLDPFLQSVITRRLFRPKSRPSATQ